jgi:DNA-binding MarR family transcriptional regulator
MANKQEMKKSEARILLYLNQTDLQAHFVGKISLKLDIAYGYTIQILNGMTEKGWLNRDKSTANPNKTFYNLSKDGSKMLSMAKNMLTIEL